MKNLIRRSALYSIWRHFQDVAAWRKRGYAAPSPHFVKQACLARNGFPDATWVETGTFLGLTTHFLSTPTLRVYSVEPEPGLFANTKTRFKDCANVTILPRTSETVFPELLPTIGGNINFWLDGHYSAGITYKGEGDTPILEELGCIAEHISRFSKVCILIDDIRCFNPRIPEYSTYPALDLLVNWARSHGLSWHIEHDIFVARTAQSV